MTKKEQQKIPTLDLATGKKGKPVTLPFVTEKISLPLIAQAVHVLRQRTRVRRAHTKDRSEVRGGGRKPWKQKGTGRARHASIRSPIWVGGGITFGPRSRHESKKRMPSSQWHKALGAALSAHAAGGSLQVVKLPSELPTKTKDAAKLFGDARGVLLIVAEEHGALRRATGNATNVKTVAAQDVTVAHVVAAQKVWIDEAALNAITKRVA